jgi:hypothetical protein
METGVNGERDARLKFYEGVREATLEHLKATEDSLRRLEGVEPAKIAELISELNRLNQKMMDRIDRYIRAA